MNNVSLENPSPGKILICREDMDAGEARDSDNASANFSKNSKSVELGLHAGKGVRLVWSLVFLCVFGLRSQVSFSLSFFSSFELYFCFVKSN